MKLVNNIGWCDVSANRVIGCDKVSEGCARCYAQNDTPARVLRHRGIETWGAKGTRVVIEGFASKVRRLNKFCICDKCRELRPFGAIGTICEQSDGNTVCTGKLRRIRIFADSNSDWLDLKWKIETFADLLRDIHECPNIDFLLLTKRPQNAACRFVDAVTSIRGDQDGFDGMIEMMRKWGTGEPPKNVWIGVSVENQKAADERIPLLRHIPAKVRFLSCEPLLSKIDFTKGTIYGSANMLHEAVQLGGRHATPTNAIHWIIAGGESGKDFREMPMEAAESLHDQAIESRVAFYMKQDSARKNGERGRIPDRIWKQQFPVLT